MIPLLAATDAVHDTGLVLTRLFAIFVAAKALGAMAGLLKIPRVVGEVLAGVILANTMFSDWLQLGEGMEIIQLLAELGVIFLLFSVGLETPFEEMKRVGGISLVVAIAGVILPFVAGYFFAVWMGYPIIPGLFIGAALVATSVGITARVLAEIGMLDRAEARIILGAAVIDDVLGLMVLTVVQSVGAGEFDALRLVILLAEVVAFVGFAMWFGGRIMQRALTRPIPGQHFTWAAPQGPAFGLAVAVCLGLSAAASEVGLAAIIGAFLAGMAFAATDRRHVLTERFEAIVQFLTPFFFGFIGMQLDLGAVREVLWVALALTGLALATKVVGCGIGALRMGHKSALAIGVGMMPRGEVGIIVALIGLGMGALDPGIYGMVVLMSLLTTMITPPILVWTFRRLPAGMNGAPPAAPPSGGHR